MMAFAIGAFPDAPSLPCPVWTLRSRIDENVQARSDYLLETTSIRDLCGFPVKPPTLVYQLWAALRLVAHDSGKARLN